MDWTRAQGWIAAAVVLLGASALLLVGLSSFGIWDPWELAAADYARSLFGGDVAVDRPPLTPAMIASGFALFGIHEWAGRLPVAIGGLAAVALAYAIGARFAGRRAGVWAAAIAATTPLMLFNARQMLGAAPGFAASAAVFLCASAAAFRPIALRRQRRPRAIASVFWLVALVASGVFSALASGVLLGVAPPVLGVAAAIVARRELRWPPVDRLRASGAAAVFGVAVVIAAAAGYAVWMDYESFGFWTGSTPRGGNPPTWEVAIERVFHSFAPWSALLPIALARMLVARPAAASVASRASIRASRPRVRIGPPEEAGLRYALVGWIAFGFAAQTVFTARYGPATFLPVVGAAVACALLLRDVERSRAPHRVAAIVAFFFVGLILRDYRAYPSAPIAGLAAEGIEVPEVFNPRYLWAAVLGAFGLALALGLYADPNAPADDERGDFATLVTRWRKGGSARALLLVAWLRLGVPTRLVGTQVRRGVAAVVWLAVLALAIVGAMSFGVACWVMPSVMEGALHMTTLGVKIGQALVLLVPVLIVAIAAARLALYAFEKLERFRFVPAIAAAFAVGGYAAFGFLPALSSHFSPREVYDTYNELAADGEVLGEYRVGGRAAAYYADGDIRELQTQQELLDFLGQEQRVWAAFRADDLASINREYRTRAQRHLFVADARSARMILATNRPVRGIENQNYLAEAVLDTPPRPQHPVVVNFDNRVELLGYDLDLPHDGYVGPGEAFTITWYFRVLAPVPGSYRIFVHIDGPGERINGDHDPVDGRYPMRLWEPGDVIVDRQELRVPANYSRASLTMFLGFYSGEQRLDIVSGPADDVDRARAGILPVR